VQLLRAASALHGRASLLWSACAPLIVLSPKLSAIGFVLPFLIVTTFYSKNFFDGSGRRWWLGHVFHISSFRAGYRKPMRTCGADLGACNRVIHETFNVSENNAAMHVPRGCPNGLGIAVPWCHVFGPV